MLVIYFLYSLKTSDLLYLKNWLIKDLSLSSNPYLILRLFLLLVETKQNMCIKKVILQYIQHYSNPSGP